MPRLYESLLNQTFKNFEWLIIDDGSTDNTKTIIENYINEKAIKIRYYYKNNGGKHTALNFGFRIIQSELTFIVDSDDYLTNNAIEIIEKKWQTYRHRKEISGICFLRGKSESECIGDTFPNVSTLSYIDMRIKNKISGDKAEIFRTSILKNKSFPEVSGEKFIGEDYIWCDIGKEYLMAWCNDIIYICNYLEGGLSLSGKMLRIRCPIGGMLNSSMMLTKEFPFYFRLKKAILYNCYYLFAEKSRRSEGYTNKGKFLRYLTFPFGVALYYFWKYKYSDK